jgi:hypothetical protein
MKKSMVQTLIYLFAVGIFSQLWAMRSEIITNNFINNTRNVEIRQYNYPPDYMRREPVLNYPGVSMFQYGNDVMLPTADAVKERGFLFNYWHITDLENGK